MKKRFLAILLTLCMTLTMLPLTAVADSSTDLAYPVEGGNLYFDKATGTITDCDSSVTGADIPAEIDGVAVTSIGDYAFYYNTNLTSVTIPSSVTSIGNSAFSDCSSLTSVMIPNSVTSIGDDAFGWCSSLTSVTIPDSVTSMGNSAFAGCLSLTSVTIPDSVTSIGDSAFSSCYNLTSVTIPNSVTSIGDGAFSCCDRLTSVTIPNSVTSIGDSAFSSCYNLTSVTIPNSVTSIGDSAFYNTGYYKDGRNWNGGALYLDHWLLNTNNGLPAEYIIPDETVGIAGRAFSWCTSLTSVTIPNSVTSIGDGAFVYCGSLTSVMISEGVTSIGNEAFYGCESLTSVTIPSSVTSIGDYVFYSCSVLTSVTIPDSVTSIGDGAFEYCGSLTNVTIPNGVTRIGEWAFYGCRSLTNVTIPNSVTNIGDYAFSGCTSLTSVTISKGVTSIGFSVFSRCTSLTSVTIPNSVTSIDDDAFYNCTSLTSACFMGDAPVLGDCAFQMRDEESGEYMNIPGLTLYYIEGKEGWTTPTWNGYPTATWTPAHEHSYTDTVTLPTCTEKGYTTHTCSICGDSYVDTYVDALGHNYIDGVCTVCGAKDPDYKPSEPDTQPADAFTDVGKNQWYYNSVNFAVENNLFLGTSDTTFSPNASMTRAMLVTVLWRLDGKPEAGTQTAFRDVPESEYYAQPVAWASANGIVMGTSTATFSPNGKITREQMAAILFRYAQQKGYDTSKRADLSKFPDNGKVSDYAREALAWANAEGLVNGDEQANGTVLLDPAGNATRAQVAAILMRYVENIVK